MHSNDDGMVDLLLVVLVVLVDRSVLCSTDRLAALSLFLALIITGFG